jgi:hypothetical protein
MSLYLDSSALVKLVKREAGQHRVGDFCGDTGMTAALRALSPESRSSELSREAAQQRLRMRVDNSHGSTRSTCSGKFSMMPQP